MMIEQATQLVVAAEDRDLLTGLITSKENIEDADPKIVSRLAENIKKADVFTEDDFPWEGIRLNSKVVVRDKIARVNYTYTLVTPEEADHQKCKLSVFSSMGSALFGHKRGDEVFWQTLNKKRYLIVMAVSQLSY